MCRRMSERGSRDFCFIDAPLGGRLSAFERLTLTGGADLERAIERMAGQVRKLSLSSAVEGINPDIIKAAAEFYHAPAWRSKPATFFETPHDPGLLISRPVHGLGDGSVIDLEFKSSYRPKHDRAAEIFEQSHNNQRFHVRWWRHEKPAAATIIAIHGLQMGDQRVNSLAFLPGVFYRTGLDIALVELPFHGRRAGSAIFPGADLILTNEALAQTIGDLRQLKQYLANQSDAPCGVLGMSLGGYCAALWASLEQLAFCITVVPLVSMVDTSWRLAAAHLPKECGITRRDFEHALKLHAPLTHRLQCAKERTLIIAGRGDSIVPAKQPRQLWQHWGRPEFIRLRGGHAAHLRESSAFEAIARLFGRLGYLDVVSAG